MSRSYRKPYTSVTGVYTGSGDDKRVARRLVRRAENRAINNCQDFENFLLPHKYECSYNDPWGWGRDGKQYLCVPTSDDWSRHCLSVIEGSCMSRWGMAYYAVWPPEWKDKLTRK
jgi:hypothetical protein